MNYVLVLLCTIKNVVVPLKIKEIYIISNNRYSLHCMHIFIRFSGVNEKIDSMCVNEFSETIGPRSLNSGSQPPMEPHL